MNLSHDEANKIRQAINKEYFKQTIERKQVNHLPNIWQWIISILITIISIGTIVILIIGGR